MTPAIVVSSLTAVTAVVTGLLFWAALAWCEAAPLRPADEEAEADIRPVQGPAPDAVPQVMPPVSPLAGPSPEIVPLPQPEKVESLPPPGPNRLECTGHRSAPATFTRICFSVPEGVKVGWFDVRGDSLVYATAPRKSAKSAYFFEHGVTYRLRLSAIPKRPGLDLCPTVAVAAETPKTRAFLEKNTVPLEVTEEELQTVCDNKTVVKVVYLPNRRGGEATAGTPAAISAVGRPRADVVREAERLGTVLLVIRFGSEE